MGPRKTTRKAASHDPRRLGIGEFARLRGELSGQWPLQELARLAGSTASVDGRQVRPVAHAQPRAPVAGPTDEAAAGQAGGQVRWKVSGRLSEPPGAVPQPWLHLEAQACLEMQCQRCLGAVVVALSVDRDFRFVMGEDEAARQDEQSDEDVLPLARELDLQALVEDELILALPLVPRHDRCPSPLTSGTTPDSPPPDAAQSAGAGASHRPFEVLATLATKRRGMG